MIDELIYVFHYPCRKIEQKQYISTLAAGTFSITHPGMCFRLGSYLPCVNFRTVHALMKYYARSGMEQKSNAEFS